MTVRKVGFCFDFKAERDLSMDLGRLEKPKRELFQLARAQRNQQAGDADRAGAGPEWEWVLFPTSDLQRA